MASWFPRRRSRLSPVALVVLGAIGLLLVYPVAGIVLALLAGVVAVFWFAAQRRRAQFRADQQLGYSLDDLDRLSGAEFEEWVTSVLESSGISAENIRDRGDFGVDVIATVDRTRVGIQVKRFSRSVGNSAIQEALAGSGYHDCSLAAVVTQSKFTRAARAQAERARVPVLLVDRDNIHDLAGLLREFAGP